MSEIVEFETEDGTLFAVEVSEPEDYGHRRVATEPDDDTPRSFSRALDRIRPVTEELVRRLRDLSAQPEEVEVAFGIKLSGKFGALFASANTEATFNVTLKWKNAGAQTG